MGKKMRRKVGVFDATAPYYPSDALSLDELAYWIAFSRVQGIGPVRFKMLLKFFQEDVAAAWHATSQELTASGLDQKTLNSFLQQRATIVPQQELERLERLRIQTLYFLGTPTRSNKNFSLAHVDNGTDQILFGKYQ